MLHHMATLAKSHAMLKEEHEKLKKDHEALKESHTDKLKALAPLLQDGNKQNVVMSQMYTILAECSTVTLGGIGLKLALSETNKKSGHHYIILAEPGHPEYKFKLEWVLDTVGYEAENKFKRGLVATDTVARYRFMLYSLVNDIYPAITGKSFSVKVVSDETNRSAYRHRGTDRSNLIIADVCCGKSLREVPVSVDKDLQLLGKLNINSNTSNFCITFIHHVEQNYGCSCTNPQCACHKKVQFQQEHYPEY